MDNENRKYVKETTTQPKSKQYQKAINWSSMQREKNSLVSLGHTLHYL